MKNDTRYLAWMDLETTGLDPEGDPIIEAALVITENVAPYRVVDTVSVVIAQPKPETWKARMVPVVAEMHTKTGLIAEVDKATVDIVLAEEQIIARLALLGSKREFMLAGSGVTHFDRHFIKAQMPRLEKWLAYPMVDVGVMRRMLATMGGDELIAASYDTTLTEATKHRALDDVMDHIAELRRYAAVIGPALNAP